MTKPVGSKCNLDCSYCFYLEKERLYGEPASMRMKPEVLESYIRDYIASQPGPHVSFAWQGGEPTLLGVEFFRTVVALQSRYSLGKR
ncbi:MAG: radical SAM protein, partial [Verrucomicrobiota bacterium]